MSGKHFRAGQRVEDGAEVVRPSRFKPRGRFEIVAVFDTAYMKIQSDPTRSMGRREMAAQLRKHADLIDPDKTDPTS